MPAPPAPETPACQGMPPLEGPHFGATGRILGVLTRPADTFADIVCFPSWLAPLVLLSILSLGFSWVMNQRVDWPGYLRMRAERRANFAQLPEDEKQQTLQTQVKFMPLLVYAASVPGPPAAALILGVVYMVAFNTLAGIGVTFKQAFGIAAHTLCIGVVSYPLAMLSLWFREPGRVTPENLLPLKLGVLLASDAPAWLRTLGGSLDIGMFWLLALVAIGFSAVNKKKAPTGKAVTIVFGLWAVWVLIKMGGATLFG